MTGLTLVTGANGFTGSAVVRALLSEGRQVRAMVQPDTTEENLVGLDVEIVHANLLDHHALRSAVSGADIIHHVAATFQFAADPIRDPAGYRRDCKMFYDINLIGTTNLLLAARQSTAKRIVYTSTMACIGVAPGRALSDETMPFDIWLPVNDYMRSKGFAENVVHSFIASGSPVVMVNPAWIVGPGEIFMTPVAQVVKSVMEGRRPILNPAGISIVDVDDVGAGHVLAEKLGRIGERYILAGENVEYQVFLDEITRAAGVSRVVTQVDPNSAFPPEFLWYNSTKARKELGWTSRPLRETVERAVAYLRNQK